MNLREYVTEKLKADGYAGLAGLECTCGVDALMPCGEPGELCAPAYWRPCTDCTTRDECDWDQEDVGGCYVADQEKRGRETSDNRKEEIAEFTWRYAPAISLQDGETWYVVGSYDEGDAHAHTQPITPIGESRAELVEQLVMMLLDILRAEPIDLDADG